MTPTADFDVRAAVARVRAAVDSGEPAAAADAVRALDKVVRGSSSLRGASVCVRGWLGGGNHMGACVSARRREGTLQHAVCVGARAPGGQTQPFWGMEELRAARQLLWSNAGAGAALPSFSLEDSDGSPLDDSAFGELPYS